VLFQPQYRMELRRADGSVLTPRAGVYHQEPFQVTTERNPPAGWRPFLFAPRGRRGSMDPKSCHTEIGEMVARLLDHRWGEGNFKRWVTAYIGDMQGRYQLRGLRALFYESLDNGATFAPYFTGKVAETLAPDHSTSGPVLELAVKDFRVEEFRRIFTGAPHRLADYARPAPVWPIGVPEMRADGSGWSGLTPTPMGFAYVGETQGTALVCYTYDAVRGQPSKINKEYRDRVTRALASLADLRESNSDLSKAAGREICTHLRARVRKAGGQTGLMIVTPVRVDAQPYDAAKPSPLYMYRKTGRLHSFGLTPLPEGHPQRITLAMWEAFSVQLESSGPATEGAPILIDSVHPARLWRDINRGYFGDLDPMTGEVAFTPIDTDGVSFDAAELLPLRKLRFRADSPQIIQSFLESEVFKPSRIAARVNGSGRVYPVDLNLREDPDTLPRIRGGAAGDIVGTPTWSQGRDLVTVVRVLIPRIGFQDEVTLELQEGRETPGIIEAPGAGVYVRPVGKGILSPRFTDLPLATETITANGLDFRGQEYVYEPTGTYDDETGAETYKQIPLDPEELFRYVAAPYIALFGDGASYLDLETRRTGPCADLWPGMSRVIEAPPNPDPATLMRGGPRVMLCLDREENGPTLRFRCIDLGEASVAVPPVITALRAHAADPARAVELDLTLNALGEPALIEVALTAWSENVRPSANDPRWIVALDSIVVKQGGAHVLRNSSAGMRVWVRARTQLPTKLDSVWAYPPGAGYLDTGALLSPFGLVIVARTGTTAELRFNPAGQGNVIEVFLHAGAQAPKWLPEHRVTTLPANSVQYVIEGLTPLSNYVVGLRHIDGRSGTSPISVLGFVTLNVLPVAPRPAGLTILVGEV
jgi:hypothetical protein